jgi:hypothetical protein
MRTCVSTSAWLAATLFLATSGACDLDVDGEVYSQEEPPQWETYSSSNAGGEVLFKVGDCEVLSITESYMPGGSIWTPPESRYGHARARGDCFSLCRAWSSSYFGYPGGPYARYLYRKHNGAGWLYRGARHDVICERSTRRDDWAFSMSHLLNACPSSSSAVTVTCGP